MPSSFEKFIVAFNRDRDSYQVPLALHEVGLLERLITDFYVPDSLAATPAPRWLDITHRRCPGLSSGYVSWSAQALWRQLVEIRLRRAEQAHLAVFKRLDRSLSQAALGLHRATGAGLFLYSGYARECFAALRDRDVRKALFVLHPHAALTGKILQDDFVRHPEIEWSHRLHLLELKSNDSARLDEECADAPDIICASSFTRRSLESAGIKPRILRVVPYGCHVGQEIVKPAAGTGRMRLLFVGQGVQRKGLHHLLKVWNRRSWDADLTIVASKLDPAIATHIAESGRVRLLSNLPRAQLEAEFLAADIFVMPSLVEGFGLVYLEAMATGCHVIATQFTGVPDLNAPPFVATLVNAGDLDSLEQGLETAIEKVGSGEYSAQEVARFAQTRSWQSFRSGIREALGVRMLR